MKQINRSKATIRFAAAVLLAVAMFLLLRPETSGIRDEQTVFTAVSAVRG